MLKHQSRPTSKIKINSKDSITTTTVENRETTTIEKKENQLQLLLGKRKNVSLGGKTQVKRYTGWDRLTSISTTFWNMERSTSHDQKMHFLTADAFY